MADSVVDTAIINKMQLEPELVAKIIDLQQAKQEEMKTQMSQPQGRGRMSEEDRKAMMVRREAFTKKYRADLRSLMGDDIYVAYLEKMLDARQSFNMGQRPGQGQYQGRQGQYQGRQRPDFQQRDQMPMGGGMDGQDF